MLCSFYAPSAPHLEFIWMQKNKKDFLSVTKFHPNKSKLSNPLTGSPRILGRHIMTICADLGMVARKYIQRHTGHTHVNILGLNI